MDTALKSTLLILTFSLTLATDAQTRKSVNYFSLIKNYDLSKLWCADSIQIDGDGIQIPFPEPLGYIGTNHQRFYIHYTTVNKSKDKSYQYCIYGKTKVKDKICSFNGIITVTNAILYKESDDARFKQGSISCALTFYEDRTKPTSGAIKGVLTTGFYLDRKGKIRYDALVIASDGFSNNQCVGTWTGYKTAKTKKCNWGDFRIPGSRDFDGGVGEFSVTNKYVKYGWQNYKLAWGGTMDNPGVQKARQNENAKWWK